MNRTKIHGMTGTPEYFIWFQMRDRCRNPKSKDFPNYGGRGIRVCESWEKSFVAFFADMGKRPTGKHSLDRINNNGNYEPGNVRWATRQEQNQNARSNIVITLNGESHCLKEWARITRIPYGTLYYRLQHGWAPEDAIPYVSVE